MSGRERIVAIGTAILLVAVVITDAIPLLRGPAPYAEWQWTLRFPAPRHLGFLTASHYFPLGFLAVPLLVPFVVLDWLLDVPSRFPWPVGCALALLGMIAASGWGWLRDRPRLTAGALMAGAIVLGTVFQLTLRKPAPAQTLAYGVMSRTGAGDWQVAIWEGRDPLDFLDRHAQRLEDLRPRVKHAATHPPGPVLYFRGWNGLCESSPALTRTALAAAGMTAQKTPRTPPFTDAAVAGALLGGLFFLVLGTAACVPIASLLRSLGRDTLSAARLAALWPLLPGAALMSPQFEALALPVAGSAALLALAIDARVWSTRVLAAFGAGTLAFAAAFASYGAAAFVIVGGSAVVAAVGWRRALRPVGLAAVAALAWLDVTMLLGHEPLEAARIALAFQRETDMVPRGYLLSLVFHSIDFVLFLGVPVVAIGLMRLRPGLDDRLHRFRAALIVGLVVFLLSGTVRGEVGRIGVPLMALALPAALGESVLAARDAAWMGLLLAILCLALHATWVLP
jgi:hypothetical protein